MPMTRLKTPGPWREATFLERPNRFVVHARLKDSDDVVRAHLPDPGRLAELLVPGRRVWVTPARTPRKTAWSCIYAESPEGHLVCVNTQRPNRLVARALQEGSIDEFAADSYVRAEATWGRSRFDFLLERDGEPLYVEVKGVSWVQGDAARFPDAVTARGTRHLHELAEIATTPGHHAALVLLVQREGGRWIEAARERDPDFAEALAQAAAAGVMLVGRRARITLEETILGEAIPIRP